MKNQSLQLDKMDAKQIYEYAKRMVEQADKTFGIAPGSCHSNQWLMIHISVGINQDVENTIIENQISWTHYS